MSAEQEIQGLIRELEGGRTVDLAWEVRDDEGYVIAQNYMTVTVEQAEDMLKSLKPEELPKETVWQFFERVPVGTRFGLDNRVLYVKETSTTVGKPDTFEWRYNYRNYWNSWEENIYEVLS